DHGEDAGFTYQSKTTRVATVDKNGLITAKKAGTTVIRVTAFNGVYADCEITVKRAPSSIKFSEKEITLTVGQTAQLAWALSSGSAGSVAFASNSGCITVNESGLVTAVSEGAAKITATTFNGKKATCTVSILSPNYNVSALRREGSSIIATTSTIKACELCVEVLNEAGSKLLFSGTAAAGEELQLAEVSVGMKGKFPDYFVLRAWLRDGDGNPLSSVYTTKRYTKAYQDFENQSPSDFPQDKVLDFGDAGYGVLVDDIIRVSGPVQQSGGSYTFSTDAKLVPGSVLLLEGEPVKVKTVTQNPDGSTTIQRDTNTYLSDFYQVLNLDAMVPMGKGNAAAIGSDPEIDFDESKPLIDLDESITSGPVTLHGAFTAVVNVKAKYDVALLGKDYFEFEASLNGGGEASFTISGSYEKNFELVIFDGEVPIGATGLFATLDLSLPVNFSASASGSLISVFTFNLGFKYDPKNGLATFQEKTAHSEAHVEGSFNIDVAAAATIGVSVLDELIGASVTGQVGLVIDGVLENMTTNTEAPSGEFQHACKGCVDVTIDAYFDLDGSLDYNITEELSGNILSLDVAHIDWHVGDSYLSLINEAISVHGGKTTFGWGICPNNKYRLTVVTKDCNGDEISGMNVHISGDNIAAIQKASPAVAYLYPGNYTASTVFDGNFPVSRSTRLNNMAQELTLFGPHMTLSGFVTDSKTGKAIPDATVTITPAKGESYTSSTTADGMYVFFMANPGSYEIKFAAQNYKAKTLTTPYYMPDTVNEFNIALDPINNFPYITAYSRKGTVQALPADGNTDGVPEVFLTVEADKWGDVTKASLSVEGCAAPFVYDPNVGVYSVSITGFDMGNHAYTFILEATCSGTMGGTEAYILQVQGGRIVKVKEFTHSERTDNIYVDAKFTSNSKYSGTLYPTKEKFTGFKTDGQNRKGEKLWENGTGYLDPELRDDGYYDIIFTTSERCLFNADYIGSSKTRYTMKNGVIGIKEQWYEGEQLPLLSATLYRDGRDKTLSPVSSTSSTVPKITVSFGYTDYRAASVTISHPDCKKPYTYNQNEYTFSSVDVHAIPSENGYTIVINAWRTGTGMDADVLVLQEIDGVLKEIWRCNHKGMTDKIKVTGSFSSQMNFSGSIAPTNVKFSGAMLEENRYDWIDRKGEKLWEHGAHMTYAENDDGSYSLIFATSVDAAANWDTVGTCKTLYSIGNGKLKMEKQWLDSYTATVKNS
ncbi:MAG: Ig-like domain-containing protein, partial [Clostridia bacterium]|nr:Ig-like domain-containing protein [Clostridia bacterium]